MSLTASGTNLLRFEDLKLEQDLSLSMEIDEPSHLAFTQLSGDHSLLHVSKEHASAFGFGERVAYGFLLLTMLSRLVGTCLESAICVSVSTDFIVPVLVGDRVTLHAFVSQVQKATRSIVFRVAFVRGSETVARGKLVTRFLQP